jgi:hypothetical protein
MDSSHPPEKVFRVWCIALIAILSTLLRTEAAIIQNDVFWKDDAGNPIFSQGGNVLKVGDVYYWYGVNYNWAANYEANPAPTNKGQSSFKSVRCYSSKDLAHWKLEGDVLNKSQTGGGWFGRLGVVHNPKTGKFVLIAQGSGPGQKGGQYFATSDAATGPFTFDHVQPTLANVVNGNSGDQSVFQDDDGKAYLVYCNQKGRSHMYISELKPEDYLAVGPAKEISHGPGREGNCMFKYSGRYYVCSSPLHGWNSSATYYISSAQVLGPYSAEAVMKNSDKDFSHVTQSGLFVTAVGSKQTTIIFGGDRWSDFGGNGIGYNEWCPITFEGAAPVFNSLSQWDIDAASGTWKIGPGNNYILNPSFEADRVSQQVLAGWKNESSGGQDPDSNSGDAHSGRFCMQQKSGGNYTATMSQEIDDLPNGTYTLTAWAKSSGGQKSAMLVARNFGGADQSVSLSDFIRDWKEVSIPDIHVTNGKCEVAISSDASGGQWLQMDDLALVNSSGGEIEVKPSAPSAAATPAPSAPTPSVQQQGGAIAAATPQPRQFASVAEAQAEAMHDYPQLGIQGSRFNAEFVARYSRYSKERPELFRDNSWPLQIASEVAATLSSTSNAASPAPAAAQ